MLQNLFINFENLNTKDIPLQIIDQSSLIIEVFLFFYL